MTSDDEAQLGKKLKKDNEINEKVYRTDEIFPKIDNLEYFPEKVLMKIFKSVNNVDLLHLSKISNRFAPITKLAFNEKYANEFFARYDSSEEHMEDELFEKIMDYFGSGITALHGYHEGIDQNHWIIRFMNGHPGQIIKFCFTGCQFNGINIEEVWSHHLNTTHFTLKYCRNISNDEQRLPEFRNLRHFCTIQAEFISELEQVKIIRNNPLLESLGLANISSFTGTLEQLKTLHLFIHDRSGDVLRQFSLRCPNIQTLDLLFFNYHQINMTSDIFAAILTFLQRCQHLCKISTLPHVLRTYYTNFDFQQKFIEIIQSRPGNSQIVLDDELTVTKNEIIRDGMPIYWIGCEAIYNCSNVRVLDLAKTSQSLESQRKQPFDMILDYLDGNDLYSLRKTSLECSKLIHKYMKKRHQEEGKEFTVGLFSGSDMIHCFAKYITNVRFDPHTENPWRIMNQQCCQNILRMNIGDGHYYSKFDAKKRNQRKEYKHDARINNQFYFPNMRHFKYESSNSHILFDISKLIPCLNLETLEIKSNVWLINNKLAPGQFHQIKTITFFARNDSIDEFLRCLDDSIERNISYSFNE